MKRTNPRSRRTPAALALAAGLVALSVLASGCTLFGSTTTTTTTKKTTTATVTKGNLLVGLIADGRIQLSTYALAFTVSSTVKAIDVAVGDKVTKGQTLAELDDTVLQRAVVTAQNNLDRSTAGYNDAVIQHKINLVTDQIALTNATTAYNGNPNDTMTQLQYQLAKERYSNLVNYDVSVITAKLAMEDAATALATAKSNLTQTVLTATVDGVVSAINYKVGDSFTVSQNGFNTNANTFLTLIDPSVVYLTSSVTEGDIASVKAGQTMKISVDAASLVNVPGKVTAVSETPSIASTGIVTYTVTGTLDDPNVDVLQGESAVITYLKTEKDNVLYIPVKAVTTSSDGIQTVNVKDSAGKVTKVEVTTGISDGTNVEVVDGLTEGQTVVIGSISQ